VVAFFTKEDNSTEIIAYEPIKFVTQEINGGFPKILLCKHSPLFLVIVGVILVVLLGLVIKYYRKAKITKQKLDFELHDVRNVANLSSIEQQMKNQEGKPKEKYLGLVSDESFN
jgi:hypothetical protein